MWVRERLDVSLSRSDYLTLLGIERTSRILKINHEGVRTTYIFPESEISLLPLESPITITNSKRVKLVKAIGTYTKIHTYIR